MIIEDINGLVPRHQAPTVIRTLMSEARLPPLVVEPIIRRLAPIEGPAFTVLQVVEAMAECYSALNKQGRTYLP
jgi:hypothetical protein